MKRIAIVGGGISGVSAAYELTRQQMAGAPVEFVLLEASHRLGGIVETERRDGYIIECGPDSWVSEKPLARELAVELGLEPEIIFSRDQHRKTYLAEGRELRALPDGMRMMVPLELENIANSPLFSASSKAAYAREPQMAEQLKSTVLANQPGRDESLRDFVIRHFGQEVANTIAAPLLAGVFGGDIATLSARAVLPAYVALEHEYGSLILGLRNQPKSKLPIFSTLRNGLSGLIDGMASHIPPKNISLGIAAKSIEREDQHWRVLISDKKSGPRPQKFDAVIVASPAKATAQLLNSIEPRATELLPRDSSSAIVVAFAFTTEQAKALRIPEGFGFLVPQRGYKNSREDWKDISRIAQQSLLACTFVDQKFPNRAPEGAILLRAFFGGPVAPQLLHEDDAMLGNLAHAALENILGKLPGPHFTLVRRWPDSLPLYAVGHLERIAELESHLLRLPTLRLIGNAYRGVGLPDLIRDARNAAREIVATVCSS